MTSDDLRLVRLSLITSISFAFTPLKTSTTFHMECPVGGWFESHGGDMGFSKIEECIGSDGEPMGRGLMAARSIKVTQFGVSSIV